MALDLSRLLATSSSTLDQTNGAQPLQTPVPILDLERGPVIDMFLPMSDPCPACGGFCMQVGDWVCWGHCHRCELAAERDQA